MKTKSLILLMMFTHVCCNYDGRQSGRQASIEGTWQLVSATVVQDGDTTTTSYGAGQNMIKIINGSHFAFLNHDSSMGKDSSGFFAAGGGPYTLSGNLYTEYLEYCSDRQWEGHEFEFTVTIENDTLIQTGIEKVAEIGVERQNTEKYARVK